MKVKPLEEVIKALAPVADEVGVEIIDAKWDMRAKSLTLFIDKTGGIDLNTCEAFHRAVDLPLDELDPTFGEAYTLNCSSPGLDRPFTTERDFLRHMGEKVEAKLYAPFEGKKEYVGVMRAYDGKTVTVQTEQDEIVLPLDKIAKICLAIEF